MGNSAPANSSLIRERLKGKILTAAECLEIADRKMGEVVSDRRHGKETQSDGSSLAGSRREDCTDRGDPPWPVGHRVSLQTPLRSRSDRRCGWSTGCGTCC